MKVVAYDPSKDSFFVAATWDEYRQLAAKYEIDAGGMDVDAVIEEYRLFLEDQKDSDEYFAMERPYTQYIMELYGIDTMPDVCLMVDRDLSVIALELYDYPFGHMWNGWSPWTTIEPVEIGDLSDLAALECTEKGEAPTSRDNGEDEPVPESEAEPFGENPPGHGYTIADLIVRSVVNMKKGGMYNLYWSRKELTAQMGR